MKSKAKEVQKVDPTIFQLVSAFDKSGSISIIQNKEKTGDIIWKGFAGKDQGHFFLEAIKAKKVAVID